MQSRSEVVISEDNLLNLTGVWNYGNEPDIDLQMSTYTGVIEMRKLGKYIRFIPGLF